MSECIYCNEGAYRLDGEWRICDACEGQVVSDEELTQAALAPKRYIAWNKETGRYLGRFGFCETDKSLTPRLSETALLLIRHTYLNVEWGVI